MAAFGFHWWMQRHMAPCSPLSTVSFRGRFVHNVDWDLRCKNGVVQYGTRECYGPVGVAERQIQLRWGAIKHRCIRQMHTMMARGSSSRFWAGLLLLFANTHGLISILEKNRGLEIFKDLLPSSLIIFFNAFCWYLRYFSAQLFLVSMHRETSVGFS